MVNGVSDRMIEICLNLLHKFHLLYYVLEKLEIVVLDALKDSDCMLKTEKFMGFNFINTSMNEFVGEIEKHIETSTKAFIVTANPEIVMYAKSDKEYEGIVKEATYVTPDGIGVIIGSKIIGRPIQERLPGFDFMGKLLELSNEKGYRVYFLGAKEEVIRTATNNIQEKFPNITIAGYHNGFFDWNDHELLHDIKERKPDIIFVGLGFPRQEKWIAQNMSFFEKGIFIGVGGSFDVWAGTVKRAPLIWQKMNLEWLYRLVKQPSRWRRMLVLPVFLGKVLKIRFSKEERLRERG